MENLVSRMPSSAGRVCLAAGLLLSGWLSVAPTVAGEGSPVPVTVAAVAWADAKPMRLGLRAEQWNDTERETRRGAGREPKAPRLPSQCRKWQSMALQLGETFAGYTLRHTVLQRVCGDLGDARLEDSWDWPWSGFASGRMAPPRMLRTIEAWNIHCGKAGTRQRCAMLHAEPTVPGTPAIVTHFVIDMVAGRESVLWRVFVAADGAMPASKGEQVSKGEPAKDLPIVAGEARKPEAVAARASTRGVHYRLGETEYVERFSKCAAAGCIMEANLLRGGQVATSLWDGNDIALAVTLGSGATARFSLPARGFRAGLAELVRQRRDEFHATRR